VPVQKKHTITFLGTGTSQGVPLIGCTCQVCMSTDDKDKRLRSSIHIQTNETSIVIVFTHGHKDHTAGFDDIRAFNYIQQQDMEVYCDERVEEVLRKDFDYVFTDYKYPGVPRANLHRIVTAPFTIGDINLVPIELLHFKLPVYGFRIGDFTYITDANTISDREIDKIRGTKILVLNALRKEPHISHFTLDEAIELAQEINAEQTYFTHISHQLGLYDDIEALLPKGISLAFDGLVVTSE